MTHEVVFIHFRQYPFLLA